MRGEICTLLASLFLCAATVWADLPFRNHRYDAFKVLSIGPENIVFIGNSITNMNEWWESFGDDPRILNRGVSGTVSDEVLANLESFIAGKPAKVFLMIGTNDLATEGINTVEHVVANITAFIDRVQRESPSTEIYIQSILPSNNGRDPELQKATNAEIKKVCDAKRVTYIDLWNQLFSITQNHNHSLDNLHLFATGYKIWCEEIEKYVGMKSAYPAGLTNQSSGLSYSLGMRSSSFGAFGVKAGDVLIIGDEMVHGGEWHELLGNAKVKNRGTSWGYPGVGISAIRAQIHTILKGRADNAAPAQIYLYAGVADVNNANDNLDDIAKRYVALIDTVRALAPGVPLRLMSLLPRTSADNTAHAAAFNAKLKAIADTIAGVAYIDIFTPLVKDGAADPVYITQDYLYGRGYVKVAQVLARTISGCRPISDEEAEKRLAAASSLLSKSVASH